MEWFKKHTDALIVISAVLSSVLWMNGKFNDFSNELNQVKIDVMAVKTDVAIIKTILIMKQIMPCELAEKGE